MTQELNDKAISTKSKEARFKISPKEFEDHTLGEIVSLKYVCEHRSSESKGYLHKETTLRGRLLALKYQVKQGIMAFKDRENWYLDDILDLEEKLSSHDRIVYKMGQSIQTIHMLGKKPNKVYEPFLQARLGYTNPKRLKRAITAQPKIYDGDSLHSNKLIINSPDSEETLKDVEESRIKMRHKMVQLNYEKLNALYETFVPQQELSAEQKYFSIPSTSDNGSESKDVPSESPVLKMSNESRLLKMIDTLEFYKTDVIPISNSLYKSLKEIKDELIEDVQEMLNIFESMEQKVNEKSPTEILLQNKIDRLLEVSLTREIRDCVLLSVEQQKHELLKDELEKSSSDSKDIQANLLNRIKILENNFKRSQAQSIAFELKLQHQKEKMACDVSWKSKMSTLHDENQKTYAFGDIRAENQNLLLTISKVKNKLRTIEKRKNVNTKFDKSETIGKLVCVTPFNKNLANKDKNASNTKVNSDRSKPVTSQSIPKTEQSQKHNENVIARSMYKINKQETKTPDSKANTNLSTSTGVGSSNSVRRPKSKDNKLKNSVLKNTKSSSTYDWKTTNSACLDSNKCETKTLNVCQTNACMLNSKTVTAVNDGLNIVCISYGLDVFLHSLEKCVAHHAISKKSSVIQLVLWIVDSGCSKHMTGNLKLLRNFVEKFMGTVHFGNDHFAVITGYGDYVQGNLTICHVYYVEGLRHNLFLVEQFCDGDLEVAFRSNTCYVRNLEGEYFLTGSCNFNLYNISISDLAASSPVCLMSKATSTKSWLWHRRLSHLNFGTINHLTKKDLVDGLPKFKYDKDHLCSACEQVKSKKASFPPKLVPSTKSKLELLHMDLCGLMRVANSTVPKGSSLKVRSDNGTEFKNEKLQTFYAKLGITHNTSTVRMPQQNGVVERRNHTLVEAARTMLIFSKTLEFFWAEAIATACFTQNRSLVHTRYNKAPYELIKGRKLNVQYFHVFRSLCYPINDRDDLG
ncbi:retrovirus-related pol polyprotein from transposon TNT 1-94, partial [Tanacetum coccineum]